MRGMKNLRVIEITAPRLFQLFFHLSFPLLLRCTVPLSPDIFPFLCANPTISSLSVAPSSIESWVEFERAPIRSIYMPNLRRFEGPDIVACSVLPGSPVSQVGILWPGDRFADFSRAMAAVASSKPGVDYFSNLIHSWDPALLAALAKHTPRIQVLQIRNIRPSSVTSPPKKIFLSAMDDTLHGLPHLMVINIVEGVDQSFRPAIHWNEEDLEFEFKTVRRWREISPKLDLVTLSSITSWMCIDDVWSPMNSNKLCPTAMRCLKWFFTKVLTSSELPPEYRFFADAAGGADEMKALEEAVKRDGVVPPFDILRVEEGDLGISFPVNT
ncbi:hypothetical protein B0H19DRAFT_1236839 [Mycena capillaripes]|nr:hypothetical protein B0H19DRAFT_1236839 [Mycena capillaripes]